MRCPSHHAPRHGRHQSTPKNNTAGEVWSMSALTLLKKEKCETRPRLFLLPSRYGRESAFELDLGITEIAGVAGSGKTQIALGLCISCALSSCRESQNTDIRSNISLTEMHVNDVRLQPASGVINQTPGRRRKRRRYKALYVSMGEGTTQAQITKRLNMMAQERQGERRGIAQFQCGNDVMNRILTRFVRNEDEFIGLINTGLQEVLAREGDPIGLVVFDSIAGMFRQPETNLDRSFYANRSEILFHSAAKLKQISEHFSIPIVVVNQVTTSFTGPIDASSRTVPALGLTWANCVNTSYILTRSYENDRENIVTQAGASSPTLNRNTLTERQSSPASLRSIHLRLSPKLAVSSVSFTIDAGGPVQHFPQSAVSALPLCPTFSFHAIESPRSFPRTFTSIGFFSMTQFPIMQQQSCSTLIDAMLWFLYSIGACFTWHSTFPGTTISPEPVNGFSFNCFNPASSAIRVMTNRFGLKL